MKVLVVATLAAMLICGCADESQEELAWAKKQTEETQRQLQSTQQQIHQTQEQALLAQQEAEKAHSDLQHVQRLRDIDRMKCDTAVHTATVQTATWWAVLVGFSVLLIITLLWLAREVRMRRILSHILLACKRRAKEVQRE